MSFHSPANSTRICLVLCALVLATVPAAAQLSVARQWNDELLDAIRNDLARPTVHARNLFHVSAATYDAWAAYGAVADTWLNHETASAAESPSAFARTGN